MITFNNINTVNNKPQNNMRVSRPILKMKNGLSNDVVSFSGNNSKVSKGVEIFAQSLIDSKIKGLAQDGEALLKGDFTGTIYLKYSHHEFVNSVEVKKIVFYRSDKGRKIPKETYTLDEKTKTFTETYHRPNGAAEKTYTRDISSKNYLGVTYHDVEGRPRVEFKLIPFSLPLSKSTELIVYTDEGNKFLSYQYDKEGMFQEIRYGENNQPRKTIECKDKNLPQKIREKFLNGEISKIKFYSEQIFFKKR